MTTSLTASTLLVVDSSVAVKWFVEEEAWTEARGLLAPGRSLIAPDLASAEIASALIRKVRRNEFPADGVVDALDEVNRILSLVPSRELFFEAQSFALSFSTSFYDCLFLSLALRENAMLVTADKRFVRGMGGRFAAHISLITQDGAAV